MPEYTLYVLKGNKLLEIYWLDNFEIAYLKILQELENPTFPNATSIVVRKNYKIIAKIDYFK